MRKFAPIVFFLFLMGSPGAFALDGAEVIQNMQKRFLQCIFERLILLEITLEVRCITSKMDLDLDGHG